MSYSLLLLHCVLSNPLGHSSCSSKRIPLADLPSLYWQGTWFKIHNVTDYWTQTTLHSGTKHKLVQHRAGLFKLAASSFLLQVLWPIGNGRSHLPSKRFRALRWQKEFCSLEPIFISHLLAKSHPHTRHWKRAQKAEGRSTAGQTTNSTFITSLLFVESHWFAWRANHWPLNSP